MNDTERRETDREDKVEAFRALLERSSLGAPLGRDLRRRANPDQAWHVSVLAGVEGWSECEEDGLREWRNRIVHHGSYSHGTAVNPIQDIDVILLYQLVEAHRLALTADEDVADED